MIYRDVNVNAHGLEGIWVWRHPGGKGGAQVHGCEGCLWRSTGVGLGGCGSECACRTRTSICIRVPWRPLAFCTDTTPRVSSKGLVQRTLPFGPCFLRTVLFAGHGGRGGMLPSPSPPKWSPALSSHRPFAKGAWGRFSALDTLFFRACGLHVLPVVPILLQSTNT